MPATEVVAGYRIGNKLAPEKCNSPAEHADPATMKAWYDKKKESTSDLQAFYEMVINVIREVDPTILVMADASWYAAADAFYYWPAKLTDERMLYTFHMNEPYAATIVPNMKSEKPYQHPGMVPYGDVEQKWDSERVKAFLAQLVAWVESYGVAHNRVFAGEFGCMRRLPFCAHYLGDVLTPFEANKLHWAFYSLHDEA